MDTIERSKALNLLKKYNLEAFHIQHALTVEAVMRYFAEHNGFNDDADFWAIAGLLHDIDFELYPDEHCIKAAELLKEINASDELIHAICSHGYGLCCNIEPINQMEKTLFTIDELTGIIGAAAKMRPSKSTKDMNLKSLKKKFKDKRFAAGCSRDIIIQGAQMLNIELDDLLQQTLDAMAACEDTIADEMSREI